jgi:hypothetical protein
VKVKPNLVRKKSGEGQFHHHEQTEGSNLKKITVIEIMWLQCMHYFVLNGFGFWSFVAVRADNFETPFPVQGI